MVQIIGAGTPRGPTLGQQLSAGIGKGLEIGQQMYQQHQQRQAMKELGLPENVSPEIAKTMLTERLKGESREKLLQQKMGMLGGLFGGGQSDMQSGNRQMNSADEGMIQEGGFDASQIPDEKIAQAALIDPNVARQLQHAKDVALREKTAEKKHAFEKEKFEYGKGAEKEKMDRHEASEVTKPLMLELQQARKNIPLQEQAIEDIKNAVPEVGALDYLADVTGFEPLRSASGAKLKTAIKDFFLSDLTRAGSRPNQWIEQQLADALPKIGRSEEANLVVAEGMKFKVDLAKKRIELIDRLSEQDTQKHGYVKSDIDSRASKLLKPYVDQRKKDLIDDISKIKKKHASLSKEAKNKKYVQMLSPDGEIWEILPSDVEEAESNGYTFRK